jgi:hypothetical protein
VRRQYADDLVITAVSVKGTTMTIRTLGAVLSVAAAAAIPVPVAQADDVVAYEFGDPSKNIACSLKYWPIGTRGSDRVLNTVQCDIATTTWMGPQVSGGTLPCADPAGYSFMLRETGVPTVQCFTDGQVIPTVYTVLEFGQSRTAGSITCTSAPAPAGITCINADSGSMFSVSSDAYSAA